MPPVPDGLHDDHLTLDGIGLRITARITAAQACCRVCERASARVHNTYRRTFKDQPCQDRAVTWQVQVRCFRCSPTGGGRIFAEPVPGLGIRKARRSDRLAEAQTNRSMVLDGEPGARFPTAADHAGQPSVQPSSKPGAMAQSRCRSTVLS